MSTHEQAAACILLTLAHMQGGGCFWCLEACYQMLKGVSKVHSGYAGGKELNPTYQQVSICRLSCISMHADVSGLHALLQQTRIRHMYTRVDACVHQDITVHQVKVSGQYELG
jgi:hypothetical protein